jgi:hypothetical protein
VEVLRIADKYFELEERVSDIVNALEKTQHELELE